MSADLTATEPLLSVFDAVPGQLRTIMVLDDCLAADASWAAVGGCSLADGRVSFLEFGAALPQGHPSWRNDPAYAHVRLRGSALRNITAFNAGGRAHTFTPVAAFGGGVVSDLNAPGQAVAPDCANPATFGASLLSPGGSLRLDSLQPGVHRFQCCIHPWMRTELRAS